MPDASTIAVFLAAVVVLVLVPGPNILYIVARSVHQGRQAGLVSVAGVNTGTLVHVGAAAFGLSALLASSMVAFAVVKYAGAAYLVYLGVRTLLAREHDRDVATLAPAEPARLFWQGVLVNVLNPKTALFFLAFLPQFIDPERGSVAGQTLILGGLLIALGACNDIVYALLAGSMGAWLKRSRRIRAAERRVTGSVYLGLGVVTALTGADPGK